MKSPRKNLCPRPSSRSSFVIRHSSFAAAFTLIEILTVVAIISILTTLTLPALKSLSHSNNLASAQNQIRALLSQARSIAISQHRQAGIVFFEETSSYSLPLHSEQTAMQIFVEDYDQFRPAYKTPTGKFPADAGDTVFLPYSTARQYLPTAVKVAALNDDPAHLIITGDDKTATKSTPQGTRGVTRAILFDAAGQMITRHGLAHPDLTGDPGTYPRAAGDWNFTTKNGQSNMGISSPGIFLVDMTDYLAQNFPPGKNGDPARNAWFKSHASTLLVNPNTGALLP